jgi:hypothetical protein
MSCERHQYVEYIAKLLRDFRAETSREIPDGLVICSNWYAPVAQFDELLGMQVIQTDVPTSSDFWFCFYTASETDFHTLKWLRETMELTPFEYKEATK